MDKKFKRAAAEKSLFCRQLVFYLKTFDPVDQGRVMCLVVHVLSHLVCDWTF